MNKLKQMEIFLIEDNPADIRLTIEALKDGKLLNPLNYVMDGEEALQYLRKEGKHINATRPDIILLDLNIPKISGIEVLAEIKKDESLKTIPVIVLTTSSAEQDIVRSYKLNANCYITKPVDFNEFMRVIITLEEFWVSIVKLPPNSDKN